MKRVELADRLANIWQESRARSGKSQDYVAKALGVSKKTIQNWECGLASPNFRTAIEWFDVIDVPMYPYLMEVLYPVEMKELSTDSHEEELRKALHKHVDQLDSLHMRELLYLLSGKHGSSPTGLLDVMAAYLHLPLHNRVTITQNILVHYEMACKLNLINDKEHVLPNYATIRRYFTAAQNAVLKGKKSYIFMEEEE